MAFYFLYCKAGERGSVRGASVTAAASRGVFRVKGFVPVLQDAVASDAAGTVGGLVYLRQL